MPFKKGEKRAPTAGRKKGTPNLWDRKVEDMALKYDLDPFEVLLKIACNDWQGLGYESSCYHMEQADGSIKMGEVITPNMRLKAAQEAAKYLYAQKKSVDLTSGEGGIRIEIIDYSSKKEEK